MLVRQAQAQGYKHYGNRKYNDIGDIAVTQVKDTGSTMAVLEKAGIRIQYNKLSIETSVDEVRRSFRELVGDQPFLQIDESGCPILVDALSGGYRLDKKGEFPFKDGFYDNPADCFRYGVWAVRRGYADAESLSTSVAYVDDTPYALNTDLAYKEEFDHE
jgi:hypothetical protein